MKRFSIVSLWDVLHFNAANLIAASSYLSGCASEWRALIQVVSAGSALPPILRLETRLHFLKSVERLRDAAKEMDMPASYDAADRAFEECLEELAAEKRFSAHELQKLANHADRIVHAFNAEVRARLFFTLDWRHSSFYNSEVQHFGQAVEDAFPGASRDIEEAAKCRALGCWTASVMHLMRVMEAGLGGLATHLDLKAEGNWNTTLQAIEARLRETGKKTHGKDEEQWAAEAGTHLRFVKNAWRNHAMHANEHYDEERAVAIFDNARSFMQHLATRLQP